MGGSNRRRQQRPGGSGGSGGSRTPQKVDLGPGWRQTFNAWGGIPVFGSLAVAVVVVAVLVWMNRPGSSAGTAPYVAHERTQTNGRVAGDPNAPVKIIEFADFQCPFCKQWADQVEPKLVEEFINNGTASLQYVSFAFLGQESRRAAEAAECAADQGFFWQYHDLLFLRQGKENSGVYSTGNLKRFAEELKQHEPKFDTSKFGQCLDSGEKEGAVDAQIKQARDAGVQSTPSFLINGTPMSGVQPIEVFRQAIQAAAAAANR
ncbi:MAG: DsbA family protein [Dehalococcoidia bacterium]